MKTVLPKVYFIGETKIRTGTDNSLFDYLRDTDQLEFLEDIKEAYEEGLSDGEILASFYAKSCYSALTTKKNENISRVRGIKDNVEGTIKSGHGCYDEETEVFTKEGWKFWRDVSLEDEFATLNMDDGDLEWQNPSKILKTGYDGDMIRYNSNQVDLLVTPNHNMLACDTRTKRGRKKNFSSYGLFEANTLLKHSHSLLKCLPDFGKDIKFDPLYQFIGFSIGDGHLRNGEKMQFHLSKQRKIDYLHFLCEQLGFVIEEKDNETYKRLIVDYSESPLVTKDLIKEIYENEEKVIPNKLLIDERNDRNHLHSLYDGLINSDGSVSETGVCYDTTSSKLADQFQFLCNLLSKTCNISQAACYKDRSKSFGDKPIFRCNVGDRNVKPHFNQSSGDRYNRSYATTYRGMIYCVEVPNHTLFVRRNGKSVWCGNSVFEHSVLNFMITDCSRILTHELVRHRAGTAFSQTSGRYVRTDVLDVVHDPILDPIKDMVVEAGLFLEDWYKKAVDKIGVNDMKDFSQKKKVTSALRRLLPNGQANEIGFSCNFRALRHIIQMRTSRHAEWEIRYVFNQFYDLVKAEYPAIFADASAEDVDGLFEITFANEKI